MKTNIAVIKSLLVITITIGVAGFALTQSLFRDVERSDKSTFVVGTLDLAVDGKNGTAAENITVTNLGASNTQSGGKTWVIQNVGTLPGKLSLSVTNIVGHENGCTEPETLVDSTCDDPGPNQGELGSAIATTVSLFHNNTETTVVTSDLAPENSLQYETQWATNAGTVIIPPDARAEITFAWSIAESTYQNEVQSDDASFDIVFDLKQVPL